MTKSVLIYELGALVDDNLLRCTKELAEGLERDEATVRDAIQPTAVSYRNGALNQGEHWEQAAVVLGLEDIDIPAAYAEQSAEVDQELLGRVRAQANRTVLVLVSDSTPDWIGLWRRQLQLDRLFDVHVVKSDLPTARGYAELLKAVPDRVQRDSLAGAWFVDRKPAHIAVATELGLQTITVNSTTEYASAFAAMA